MQQSEILGNVKAILAQLRAALESANQPPPEQNASAARDCFIHALNFLEARVKATDAALILQNQPQQLSGQLWARSEEDGVWTHTLTRSDKAHGLLAPAPDLVSTRKCRCDRAIVLQRDFSIAACVKRGKSEFWNGDFHHLKSKSRCSPSRRSIRHRLVVCV